MSSLVGPDEDREAGKLPVPEDVQAAVRTLLEWTGDDPTREGLIDTPKRVARAWKEYCQGYEEDPAVHLSRVFEEVGGYDEIVLLKDIPFQSHCEHHMAPIIGVAHIAYLPTDFVVGISKLARVLHGRPTTPLRGLVWGAGAFGVVFVAPALGLTPELPGAPAADLAARQLWWIATVGLVGFSLWTVIFVPGRMKWAALLLLPLPYLYGAPLPSAEPGSTNAALVTLHQQFVWATAGTNLVLWLILGVLCGWAMQRWIAPALINTPRPEPARA